MFILEASDTLAAAAGAASAITVTGYGIEKASSNTYKKLFQTQPGTSAATIYTAPASTEVFVKTIVATNPTGTARTLRLYHDGTTDATTIVPAISIVAGGMALYADGKWTFYNSSGGQILGGVSSIAGTAAEITASAATGDVTLSLPSALTFTGKTVTGGTFASPTLSGTIAGTPTWASNQAITLSTAAQPNVTSLGTLGANLLFTDATYDIGASGATRPKDIYASGVVAFGTNPATTGVIRAANAVVILAARNAANSANISIVAVGGGNNIEIGSTEFNISPGTGRIGVGVDIAPAGGGGPSIALGQGTQPTSITANSAGVWVQDVAGTAELMGFDEAGNDVQLTAHPSAFLNNRIKSKIAWGYSWSNRYEGTRGFVDMGQLVDAVEALTGKSFTVVEALLQKADWDTDQEARYQQRLVAQAIWDADTREDKRPRPADYIKKRPQKWMIDRGVKTAIVEA